MIKILMIEDDVELGQLLQNALEKEQIRNALDMYAFGRTCRVAKRKFRRLGAGSLFTANRRT